MTTTPTEPIDYEHSIIVAKPSLNYRIKQLILAAMLLGMGGWFLYDGYVTYPRENDAATAQGNEPVHSQTDIRLQRVLGYILPPIGLFALIRAMYVSRGVYRLSGQVLDFPGHPNVHFDQIRRLDRKLWDRKGIAFVDYELPGSGETRRFRIDDVIYERGPTDEIFNRIEQYIAAQQGEPEPSDSAAATDVGDDGTQSAQEDER